MSDSESNRAFVNAPSGGEVPVEEGKTPQLPRAALDVESDSGSGSSSGKKSNRPLICHECNQEGHVWRKCPSRASGSGPKCAKCGKRGHVAATCRAGGRSTTKELTVALKDAIDQEGAKDEVIKELRSELSEKKNEEKEKQKREAKELVARDCDYVDRIVEDSLGQVFEDPTFATPEQALVASAGVATSLFIGANTHNGVFLEAGLWGIPSFLVSAGLSLLVEIVRPKAVPATISRAIGFTAAGAIWLTAAMRRGVLANAVVSAFACAGVGVATYACLRILPYRRFEAEIIEAYAEETEEHGPDADLPRDNRPDANNLLELTHRNPGFARARFRARWLGFSMARWEREVVVSLEKFAQVMSPANQELDEPDSTMWRRVKAACRTIHRVNDDRYKSLDGENISFNTAVLCYTALRDAKEGAFFYSFYWGFTGQDGPKEPHHV